MAVFFVDEQAQVVVLLAQVLDRDEVVFDAQAEIVFNAGLAALVGVPTFSSERRLNLCSSESSWLCRL